MIAWLKGKLLRKTRDAVVLEAGGVGYRVFVSRQVMERLSPEGAPIELEIHTEVRQDAIQLFGFLDGEEREVFEALIGMNGVGPRAAVSVLSGIDARELARAICAGDLARLCLIPGVGKKKAERMVLELRDKLTALALPPPGAPEGQGNTLEDLRSALSNLGFRGAEVERAVGALREEAARGSRLDDLLPQALKLVRG